MEHKLQSESFFDRIIQKSFWVNRACSTEIIELNGCDRFKEMPRDIIFIIMGYLPALSVLKFRQAAKYLYQLSPIPTVHKLSVWPALPSEEAIISLIKLFPNITELSITGCKHLSNSEMKNIFSVLPKGVTKFEMQFCNEDKNALGMAPLYFFGTVSEQFTELDLSHCRGLPPSQVPDILVLCPNLKVLDLSNNHRLEDLSFSAIARKTRQLERIYLKGVWRITSLAIASISQCQHLKSIDLEGLKSIDDQCLISLSNCLKLEFVNLRGCSQIGGAKSIATLLSACQNLRGISLKFTKLQPSCFNSIGVNQNLTYLDIQGCSTLLDSDIADIVFAFPRLSSLDLRECTGFSPSIANDLSQLVDLQVLELRGTKLTNHTIQELVLPKLRILDLRSNNVSDDAYSLLPQNTPSLLILHCGNNLNITDATIKFIQKLENLQMLNLKGTSVTEEGLLQLPLSVKVLDVRECPNISQQFLKTNLSHLQKIHV